MWACTCHNVPVEVRGWPQLSAFTCLSQGLFLTPAYTRLFALYTYKDSLVSFFHLAQEHGHSRGMFLHLVQEFELRSSFLHSKCFTHQTAPLLFLPIKLEMEMLAKTILNLAKLYLIFKKVLYGRFCLLVYLCTMCVPGDPGGWVSSALFTSSLKNQRSAPIYRISMTKVC